LIKTDPLAVIQWVTAGVNIVFQRAGIKVVNFYGTLNLEKKTDSPNFSFEDRLKAAFIMILFTLILVIYIMVETNINSKYLPSPPQVS
jgi:hypothetical protein